MVLPCSIVVMDDVIGQAEPLFREEMYEKLWSIPNWDRIQRSRESLAATSVVFETGKSANIQTKWMIGFKLYPNPTGLEMFRLYWELIEAKGFPNGNVQVVLTSRIFRGNSTGHSLQFQEEVMSAGQLVESPRLAPYNTDIWRHNWLNSDRELVIKLELKIMEPVVPPMDLPMEIFNKASVTQVLANFGSILGDQATSDLKIVTSDGIELLAHKAILKAQCPVFESMFRSDFSENKTGVVNVKDVSAKTMDILLRLFYTGKLLPSWKDPDTVVEFTYAAGKYQLTSVLKLLDEALGDREEVDAFQIDVQLLDLAQKLDLKTAEKMLLVRIKKAICEVNSGAEFFKLYGYQKE